MRYKNGLNGFRDLRTQSTLKKPLAQEAVPKKKCKSCGANLRSDKKIPYCDPCYIGEIDIPEMIVAVSEEADHIEQVAAILRPDIMSDKAKRIYLELNGGSTEEE